MFTVSFSSSIISITTGFLLLSPSYFTCLCALIIHSLHWHLSTFTISITQYITMFLIPCFILCGVNYVYISIYLFYFQFLQFGSSCHLKKGFKTLICYMHINISTIMLLSRLSPNLPLYLHLGIHDL